MKSAVASRKQSENVRRFATHLRVDVASRGTSRTMFNRCVARVRVNEKEAEIYQRSESLFRTVSRQ